MKESRRWKQEDVTALGGVQVLVTGHSYQLPPIKPFEQWINCGLEMTMDKHEAKFSCPNNQGPFRAMIVSRQDQCYALPWQFRHHTVTHQA